MNVLVDARVVLYWILKLLIKTVSQYVKLKGRTYRIQRYFQMLRDCEFETRGRQLDTNLINRSKHATIANQAIMKKVVLVE